MTITLDGTSGITTPTYGGAVTGEYQVPITAFKNRIINGDFQIWQRGTSFSSAGVNEYSADRFRTEGYAVSGGTVISQQTFAGGQTDVPGYPTYYCRVQTNGAIASGQYWAFQQRIEAPQNISGYGTATVSFYAKAVSGTVAANTFSFGLNNSRASNPTLTTTWQRLTVTSTISDGSSGGYVNAYVMHLGAGTSAVAVDIANVQVEFGSTATSFDYRPYGTELALCQRYYYPNTYGTTGTAYNSTTGVMTFNFPVSMRTVPPTMTYTSGSSTSIDFIGGNQSGITFTGTPYNTANTFCYTVNGMSGRATWQTIILSGTNVAFTAEL